MEIPKIYDPKDVEPKWQKRWEELGVYRFRRDDEKITFGGLSPKVA
jgi:valyl-tRNA synthetase